MLVPRPGRRPPEELQRARLLQSFYSVGSDHQLLERLEFDLPFGWIAGLGIDDPVLDISMLSKGLDRLPAGDLAARFRSVVLAQARV